MARTNRKETHDMTASIPMPPTPTQGLSLTDMIAAATLLGSQSGAGKDTQIKLALKVVDAAYQGGIDLQANKHGTDVDDATKIAEAYVKAASSSTVFDVKENKQAKLVSCIRTLTKLGQWPKGGTGEPLSTVNNLVSYRQKVRAKPGMSKKIDDAFNTVMRFARAQLRRDQLIDASEFDSFVMKKVPDLMTGEEIVESARNALRKLHQGKAAKGTAQDQSPEVEKAIQLLTKRLKDIATARGPSAQQANTHSGAQQSAAA